MGRIVEAGTQETRARTKWAEPGGGEGRRILISWLLEPVLFAPVLWKRLVCWLPGFLLAQDVLLARIHCSGSGQSLSALQLACSLHD